MANLGLPTRGGRIAVEGLQTPRHATTSGLGFKGLAFYIADGLEFMWRKQWRDLHFVDCDFTDLLFFSCSITNCVFERCILTETGFWNSRVLDAQFLDCDLRSAAFGGVSSRRPRPNVFNSVEFLRCDLSDTAHSCELFTSCRFEDCRYGSPGRCDFHAARFEDCSFKGELSEVIFRSRMLGEYPGVPPNVLARCDFREADITWTAFFGIDLDPAAFADDPDLIFLHHGPEDWRNWLDQGHVEADEGTSWRIGEEMKRSGTPTVVSRKTLTKHSTEAVDALARLGRKE